MEYEGLLVAGRFRSSTLPGNTGWEPSNDSLVVLSGETVVGSLKRTVGGTTGERWSWSITCVLIDPHESPKIGWAATREEAQQQLAEAWRAWLARTGLREI